MATLSSGFAYLPVRTVVERAGLRAAGPAVAAAGIAAAVVLGIAGSFAIRQILGDDGPAVRRVVTLAATTAAFATAASIALLARLKEQPPRMPEPLPSLGGLARPFGRGAFNRWSVAASLLACSFLVDPFYIVHAQQEHGAGRHFAGDAVLLFGAAFFVGLPLWHRLGRAIGHRAPLQAVALGHGVMALWVFTLPSVLESSAYQDRFSDPDLSHQLFNVVFVVMGLVASAAVVGGRGYLAGLTPPGDDISFGLASLLPAVPLGFAGFAGAAILDERGFDQLALVAGGVSLVALFGTALLDSAGVRPRARRNSWQLRHPSR